MRKLNYLILLLGLLAFGSCNKEEFLKDGDYFHLSNDGAKLPIWVNGNMESDVIIITVHGGPGDGGMGMHLSRGFKLLEEKYMVAYWDQRFAALAQGHPNKNTINADQYIEDTEKVVELIQEKYPGKSLFMLGHSWGGQLSAGYIGKENNQDNLKGWIDMCGSINSELEFYLMKEWIMDSISVKMADPDANHEFWQGIVDWYATDPEPLNYTHGEPYHYISALHGDAYYWETYWEDNPIPYSKLIFSSMFSMGYYVSVNEENSTWADTLDFTPELEKTTIPALLLWGAQDGIVPATVGDYVYDHLATDPMDKKLVKIDKCCHGPNNDQPEIFFQEVSAFVETYK